MGWKFLNSLLNGGRGGGSKIALIIIVMDEFHNSCQLKALFDSVKSLEE